MKYLLFSMIFVTLAFTRDPLPYSDDINEDNLKKLDCVFKKSMEDSHGMKVLKDRDLLETKIIQKLINKVLKEPEAMLYKALVLDYLYSDKSAGKYYKKTIKLLDKKLEKKPIIVSSSKKGKYGKIEELLRITKINYSYYKDRSKKLYKRNAKKKFYKNILKKNESKNLEALSVFISRSAQLPTFLKTSLKSDENSIKDYTKDYNECK